MAGSTTAQRIILVTGGSSGIGLETARVLSLDATNVVVIASRSLERVNKSVEELNQGSGHSNVHGMELNLGSLSAVAAFVEEFRKKFKALHVLLNNAGVTGPFKYTTTDDGFETTFATNHLGHMQLTESFLESSDTAFVPQRVVIVSSGTHDPDTHSGMAYPSFSTTAEWANPTKYDSPLAYTNSKLANAMYGRYLARTLDPSKTTVAIYDPGFIGTTGLLRATGVLQPLIRFMVESLIAFNAWRYGIHNQNSNLSRSSPFLARICVDPSLWGAPSGVHYVIDFPHHVSKAADVHQAQDELVRDSRALLRSKGF